MAVELYISKVDNCSTSSNRLHDTLIGSSIPICAFGGSDFPSAMVSPSWAQRHHDSMSYSPWVQSIEEAVVSLEPRTLEGQKRNDLKVRGRCGLHATDYGLNVYCLNDRDARSTLNTRLPSTPLATHVLNRCLSWLDKVSDNTTDPLWKV